MGVSENLGQIKKNLPPNVKLVAVSKTKTIPQIMELYNQGQIVFGENKVQEVYEKQPLLPQDIEWHFIGHLQTNKIKYIASFIQMIHSIDSLKLLIEVNKQAAKFNRTINCLLQFHIAAEETKFGLDYDEACKLLASEEFHQLRNVRICGVMGMASFTSNQDQVRTEFQQLKTSFDQLKNIFFSNQNWFNEISMGMSDDFRIAFEEGSTMVRIGSALFGQR
jgi:PLP dependent protein